MNYQKQYANKINWQNKPSTSTPLNATNLNKMDNALWYIDNALYMLANAVGGGSSIRGGIISNIASNIITTHVTMRTGESLATDELLLLRSNAEGAGNNISIYTDEYSAEDYGLVDLDGEETSVTLTDTSILLLMLDTDEYTATVLGVMDENSGLAGLGIGKMTNYSSGVITTDIDLHRDPVIGDRILLYCSSDISVSNDSIKTYNDGVAVTTDIGPILPQTIVKGFNVLQCVAAIPSGIAWSVKLNVPIVAYSAGTGIMIDNNGVISNANPNYGENYDYKKIDSAIDDGNLGDFNGYCDNLIIDFHANAVSGGNAYTLTLVTGTSTITRKYAILKDRSGNPFIRDINAGMILKCESNVSGSGTELDPVVVIVLEIANWYVESGRKANTTIGAKSTAEGEYNTVSGAYGHADGYGNTASGNSASAHGIASTASGDCSVADGSYTTASGANSSAHGDSTMASGIDSSASGEGTIAGYLHQTAMGRFNENKSGNLLEVGNGSDDDDRSNALEVTADGNVVAGHDIVDGNGYTLSSIVDAISEEKTVSGNPITVTDALPYNAVSVSAEIEASQDLHGYDHPWVGGAGKNLSPVENGNNLVLCAVESGETYTFSLMASDSVGFNLYKNNSEGELIINKTPITAGRTSVTFTADSNFNLYLNGFSLITGKSFAELTSLFMVEKGSTATSYAPYSNICPISGRTEETVDDTGRNIWGGDRLADDIVAKVTGGIKDTTNHTVSYTASAINNIELFTGFEPNKQYTFFFDSSSSFLNLGIKYTDGTLAEILSNRVVSDASKSVKAIVGVWHSGTTVLNYLNCGCFIGNVAIFEPYVHSSVTIQLGQTVYGGSLNVTTGVLMVTHKFISLNGEENVYGFGQGVGRYGIAQNGHGCKLFSNDGYSDRLEIQKNISQYQNITSGHFNVIDANTVVVCSSMFPTTGAADMKAYIKAQYDAGTPFEFDLELAAPTTIQLTPTQLTMLKGYNRLSSDGGDIMLTYKADRLAAIEAALAEIGA